MKMTKEKHLELTEAFWNGDLEFLYDDGWHPSAWNPPHDSNLDHYRIRPKPALRPWKPEEVQVGALIMKKADAEAKLFYRGVITYADDGGIPQPCGRSFRWLKFDELLQEYEYSIDGGKTWLPCGVEE